MGREWRRSDLLSPGTGCVLRRAVAVGLHIIYNPLDDVYCMRTVSFSYTLTVISIYTCAGSGEAGRVMQEA